MLQINKLMITHRKDLRVILEDFSLVLNAGDKAVIIGEEGNGKSKGGSSKDIDKSTLKFLQKLSFTESENEKLSQKKIETKIAIADNKLNAGPAIRVQILFIGLAP